MYNPDGGREAKTEILVQKAVRQAAHQAGLAKWLTIRGFPPSFATHLLEDSCDIRAAQGLGGQKDVETMMILHARAEPRGTSGVSQ